MIAILVCLQKTLKLTYHCCMFFPPIRSAFPQEIKKKNNNKYIAKHITTHTYTHKYFPKKKFPYFDNALFSKNLDGFPPGDENVY